MADHFYGVAVGAGIAPSAVTIGTVTAGSNVELRVTDGLATMSKTDLLKALDAIEAAIVTSNAPA